jgi:hypothetical protein
MEYEKTGNWQQHGEKIRYREVQFYDWDGELCHEFEFNVFKRPYFFGLIGKKRWIWSITANDFGVGLGFTKDCF